MELIKTIDVLETKSKVWEKGNSSQFERKFLIEITRDEKIYNKSKFFSNLIDKSSKKKYLYLSQKQKNIYLEIQQKYNTKSIFGDIYEKYTKIFKDKNIILDSFDLRHLETFKGVIQESENFNIWVKQILND